MKNLILCRIFQQSLLLYTPYFVSLELTVREYSFKASFHIILIEKSFQKSYTGKTISLYHIHAATNIFAILNMTIFNL